MPECDLSAPGHHQVSGVYPFPAVSQIYMAEIHTLWLHGFTILRCNSPSKQQIMKERHTNEIHFKQLQNGGVSRHSKEKMKGTEEKKFSKLFWSLKGCCLDFIYLNLNSKHLRSCAQLKKSKKLKPVIFRWVFLVKCLWWFDKPCKLQISERQFFMASLFSWELEHVEDGFDMQSLSSWPKLDHHDQNTQREKNHCKFLRNMLPPFPKTCCSLLCVCVRACVRVCARLGCWVDYSNTI